jgi:hypothetical protein
VSPPQAATVMLAVWNAVVKGGGDRWRRADPLLTITPINVAVTLPRQSFLNIIAKSAFAIRAAEVAGLDMSMAGQVKWTT